MSGVVRTPAARVNGEAVLGNHESRIRDLERNAPLDTDAIRFDVDNQGGSLIITANDAIPGHGDETIIIRANTSDVPDGGDLTISAENIAELTADGEVLIDAPTIVITATNSPLTISVNGTTFSFQDDGNIVVT